MARESGGSTGPLPVTVPLITYQLGASNGTDDTAAVNAALASGGYVKGKPGQTYKLSTPPVIPSNTTLDMTGCTVTYASGVSAVFNMLQNAAVAPVHTATDAATTVGSAVVVSPTLAAVAQVNQQLAVVGAGPAGGNGGGAIWFYGTVQTIVGNNITLTSSNVNGIAASNALTGATAYLFNRDSNITVIGGLWDGGTTYGVEGGANAAWHSFNSHQMRFRRVDGLTVKDVSLRLSGFPAGGGWVFGINPGDCTDYVIERCTGIGNSTIVQGDGPLYRGIVRDIRGTTQDDMVAFGSVGFQGNDIEGDIIDLTVEKVRPNNAYSAVKFFGGTGANGVQRIVSDITCRDVKGVCQAGGVVQVIEYAGNTTFDGVFEDITAYSTTASTPQLYISALFARTVQVKSVRWPLRAGTANNVLVKTGRPVENLIIRDIDGRVTSGTMAAVWLTDAGGTGSGTYQSVTVDGIVAPDTGNVSRLVVINTAQPINRLSVKNWRHVGTASGIVVFLDSTPTIGEIEISDGRLDGGGGSSLLYNDQPTTVTGLVLKVSRVYQKSTLNGAVATLQRPATVIIADSELNLTNPAVRTNHANGTPVRVLGQNLLMSGTSAVLLSRSATQVLSASSPVGTVDQTLLTPQDGDIVYNSNATPLNGVGLAIYNTAAAKWKNLYTGTTS